MGMKKQTTPQYMLRCHPRTIIQRLPKNVRIQPNMNRIHPNICVAEPKGLDSELRVKSSVIPTGFEMRPGP